MSINPNLYSFPDYSSTSGIFSEFPADTIENSINNTEIKNKKTNLKIAAKTSSSFMYELATNYYFGLNGFNQKINKAIIWLKEASELNHMDSILMPAKIHGCTPEPYFSPTESLQLYFQAYRLGNFDVIKNILELSDKGFSIEELPLKLILEIGEKALRAGLHDVYSPFISIINNITNNILLKEQLIDNFITTAISWEKHQNPLLYPAIASYYYYAGSLGDLFAISQTIEYYRAGYRYPGISVNDVLELGEYSVLVGRNVIQSMIEIMREDPKNYTSLRHRLIDYCLKEMDYLEKQNNPNLIPNLITYCYQASFLGNANALIKLLQLYDAGHSSDSISIHKVVELGEKFILNGTDKVLPYLATLIVKAPNLHMRTITKIIHCCVKQAESLESLHEASLIPQIIYYLYFASYLGHTEALTKMLKFYTSGYGNKNICINSIIEIAGLSILDGNAEQLPLLVKIIPLATGVYRNVRIKIIDYCYHIARQLESQGGLGYYSHAFYYYYYANILQTLPY